MWDRTFMYPEEEIREFKLNWEQAVFGNHDLPQSIKYAKSDCVK